jgi:hypothetical protein
MICALFVFVTSLFSLFRAAIERNHILFVSLNRPPVSAKNRDPEQILSASGLNARDTVSFLHENLYSFVDEVGC